MLVPASEAREIVCGDNPEWKQVAKEHTDSSRWAQHYFVVFAHGDKHFGVAIAEPSTEMQEGQDIFQDADPVEFCEVVAVEKLVTAWVPPADAEPLTTE